MADYFTVSSVPATSAALASAIIRGEFNSIATGFTKVAAYTGNGGKIVAINAAGTAQEAITTTGTGSGVRATSPTLVTPILGTPTSGTLTNCTGYPISALSGSTTGTGNLVFATTPTLTTPVLGIATATSINKVAITAPATSATLTIADGKTLAASNTLTLAGTDGSTLNVGAGGTLGTAAFKNTGTSGNTVPLLDGNNTHTGTLTMSGKSIIEANASIAAHATTMDPWSLGNYVTATGAAVTFTDMAAAPQAGAEVEIYMNAAHVFTDGAVFEVDGDANWTAEIGDRVLIRAKSTILFTVHPRKKTGYAVAVTPATEGTQLATTSGTSVNFTGIPSWVTNIVLSLTTVSVNGANPIYVQLRDSGGLETTGYTAVRSYMVATVATPIVDTTGFFLTGNVSAGVAINGSLRLTRKNNATNNWTATWIMIRTDSEETIIGAGNKDLSGVLDGLSLVSAGTFDLGSANINYW